MFGKRAILMAVLAVLLASSPSGAPRLPWEAHSQVAQTGRPCVVELVAFL